MVCLRRCASQRHHLHIFSRRIRLTLLVRLATVLARRTSDYISAPSSCQPCAQVCRKNTSHSTTRSVGGPSSRRAQLWRKELWRIELRVDRVVC